MVPPMTHTPGDDAQVTMLPAYIRQPIINWYAYAMCRYCLAMPGDPCRRINGNRFPVKWPHVERHTL